jgi:hypothetical protein
MIERTLGNLGSADTLENNTLSGQVLIFVYVEKYQM